MVLNQVTFGRILGCHSEQNFRVSKSFGETVRISNFGENIRLNNFGENVSSSNLGEKGHGKDRGVDRDTGTERKR